MDIVEMLAKMNDEQLKEALNVAKDDLEKAANEEENSEWHQACFAAVIIYCRELGARGVTSATPAP